MSSPTANSGVRRADLKPAEAGAMWPGLSIASERTPPPDSFLPARRLQSPAHPRPGREGVVYSGTEGTRSLQAPNVDKASAFAAGSAAVMTPGSQLLRQWDYQACFRKMGGDT